MKEKKFLFSVLSIALIIASLLGLYSLWYLKQSANSLPANRTINVSGEGKAFIKPDLARVGFAVVSEGDKPEELQKENAEKMKASLDFIKSQGIEEKDIKTTGYNLSPRYEYDEKKKKTFISGYTVSESVSVRIKDFDKIATIVGQLPSLGINQINSVNFEVENPEKYLVEAREDAFKKAFAKADAMARQNHVRLGRVITFSENSGGGIYPRYFAAEIAGKGGPDFAPAPIEPGTEEVNIFVSVTYELR